jgi:hypothetical protein
MRAGRISSHSLASFYTIKNIRIYNKYNKKKAEKKPNIFYLLEKKNSFTQTRIKNKIK